MINPELDGINHINVYSKARTELGRLLSNFARTPFTGGDHEFQSVEGWWYWFKTGKQYPELKKLSGFAAKKAGKKYKTIKRVTPKVLLPVYRRKLECNPAIVELLNDNNLPFLHYYVFNGKVYEPVDFAWTAELWNKV